MSILVLDIGTTSMRGILYEKDGSRLAMHRCENHLIFMGDSLIEENPDDWYENTVTIIRNIVTESGQNNFEAIAVTAQRSSMIPVDSDGSPLSAAIMWQDTRNRGICKELSRYNHALFQKTGAEVSTVFSGSKMTWIRRNLPEIYAHTHKFLNIPEYVVSRMCNVFVSDTTYGSRTGLMDLKTASWDPDILKLYEVEEDKLCTLIEPGQIAGYVSAEFAETAGITQGIPVLHCGGDQQCAAIGHGIIQEGPVSVTAGTGGFIAAAMRELPSILPDGMIINRSSIQNEYILETNVLSCGAAYDWCAHELYGMEKADYRLLESELQKENFVSTPLVLPYFSGRGAPEWNPLAKAVFSGITTATRRSELFKSIMESIFMEIANQIERMNESVPVERVNLGGGLSGSDTLNQLQADIYGRPVYASDDPEATADGCLMVALCGLGVYESVYDAYQALHKNHSLKEFLPDMNLHAEYEIKRKKMNRLYRVIKEGDEHES